MGWSRPVLAVIGLSTIVGCATLPEYRDEPPTTRDVIRNARCELQDALLEARYQWLTNEPLKGGKSWNAKLNFTFEVTHSGDLSTDNTWGFPLNMGATFSANLTGQFTGTGTRKENIEFNQELKKLAGDATFKKECSENGPGGRFARLGGRLGIADLIERAHLSRGQAYDDYEKLTYDLEYTIKKNATLTPRFNLIPIGKEKTYTGNAKWTGSNSDVQKLSLTFTSPAKAKEEEKCAVVALTSDGWPDPSICPTVVYTVNVKAAPCMDLSKKQCEARAQSDIPVSLKCIWVQRDEEKGKCVAPETPQAREALRFAPPARRRTVIPKGSGVDDPADRAKLDDAFIKRRLESIESDLSRQRLGN